MHNNLNLFVAPCGDDSASGTVDAPLASMAGARNRLRALRKEGGAAAVSAVVTFEDGVYRVSEPVTFGPEDSGDITYAARNAGKARFRATTAVSGWTVTEVNGRAAWVAELPEVVTKGWTFKSLWVNGEPRPRARYPKFRPQPGGQDKALRIGEYRHRDAPNKLKGGDYAFKPRAGDLRPEWKHLYDAEVVVMHFWMEERLTQPHLDVETGWIEFARRSAFMLSEEFGPEPARYYIDNLFDELTEPGEWFLKERTGKLYYLPKEGEHPDNCTVEVPRTDQFIRLRGKPYNRTKQWGDVHRVEQVSGLRFEGLVFEFAGMGEQEPRFLFHDDIPVAKRPLASSMQAACTVPGVIETLCATGCSFTACTVRECGNYGMEIGPGSQGITVSGCVFERLGGGGLRVHGGELDEAAWRRCAHHSICDNTIRSVGRHFYSAVGILLGNTYENVVAHNLIEDLFYSGISVGWSWGYKETIARDNLILYNRIREVGQGLLSDLGAVYVLGMQPGTEIRGNHISGVRLMSYGGWGLYLDEGTSHVVLEENLVHGIQGPAFNLHYGRENIVRNNLVCGGAEACASIGRSEEHIGATFAGNVFVSASGRIYEGGYGGSPAQSFRSFSNAVVLPQGVHPWLGRDRVRGSMETSWKEWMEAGNDVSTTLHASELAGTMIDESLLEQHRHELEQLLRSVGARGFPGALAGPRQEGQRPPLRQPLTRRDRAGA